MVKMTRGSPRGFSLIEAMISLSLGGVFLASVISAWFFSTKTWKEENVRSTLRIGIEQAMERIKEDVRLTDYNGVLYYPSAASAYSAISLPHATPNANGTLTFSSNQISWDKTIIYHVYDNGGTVELRRTLINGFADAATRQTDLDTVAVSGTLAGAQTRTIFKVTSATLEIVAQNPTFDGYNASVARSANISFGSATLSPGTHQVRFEITGKNASSSDYQMGIDSIAFSPSGGSREAEALTLAATSGQTSTNEDMTLYAGLWEGNYQKQYQSVAVGNYMTFNVDYDQWLESNFSNMTHSSTEVVHTNPALSLSSRETQGAVPDWQASTQTLSGSEGVLTLLTRQSVRTVVNGSYLSRAANMIRIKFTASSNAALQINSAYFGERSGSEALGTGTADFSAAPTGLYFDNLPVAEGSSDPIGVSGSGTSTSITIPAGSHAWTNWFEYSLTTPAPDFLISMNVSSGSEGDTWTQTETPVPVHSYRVDDTAGIYTGLSASWSGLAGYATSDATFAAVEIGGWSNTGTATSQIYDTKMTAPAFSQLVWDSSLPVGTTAAFKVRTSGAADMTGASDWSVVTPITFSPSLFTGLTSQRYLQFQVALTGAPPYTTYPYVDNVSIEWPGQTSLVDLSGYYTKKSNYGIFKVLVDGVPTVKGLEIKLSASQNYRGVTYTCSLNSEEKPRNTGK